MSIKRKIRFNLRVRGLINFWHLFFGLSRRRLGEIGNNVTLTPPLSVGNPNNVIIGDNVGIGPNAFISAVRAKFVVKNNCAIAEGLTVHTGNEGL